MVRRLSERSSDGTIGVASSTHASGGVIVRRTTNSVRDTGEEPRGPRGTGSIRGLSRFVDAMADQRWG